MTRLAASGALATIAACSSFHLPFHVPFTRERAPDLTPARASAENMIRLDAQLRSGCEQVDNIERSATPGAPPPSAADARNPAPQRWVARTCNGDISYDVVTRPGNDGPVVTVTPVPGPMNRPMNPHFIPAMPASGATID